MDEGIVTLLVASQTCMKLAAAAPPNAIDGSPHMARVRAAISQRATPPPLVTALATAPLHEMSCFDHGTAIPPIPSIDVEAMLRSVNGTAGEVLKNLCPSLAKPVMYLYRIDIRRPTTEPPPQNKAPPLVIEGRSAMAVVLLCGAILMGIGIT